MIKSGFSGVKLGTRTLTVNCPKANQANKNPPNHTGTRPRWLNPGTPARPTSSSSPPPPGPRNNLPHPPSSVPSIPKPHKLLERRHRSTTAISQCLLDHPWPRPCHGPPPTASQPRLLRPILADTHTRKAHIHPLRLQHRRRDNNNTRSSTPQQPERHPDRKHRQQSLPPAPTRRRRPQCAPPMAPLALRPPPELHPPGRMVGDAFRPAPAAPAAGARC